MYPFGIDLANHYGKTPISIHPINAGDAARLLHS